MCDGRGAVVSVEDLQALGWVQGRQGDAQLGRDVGEGVVVRGGNERVIPVNYLFDHVQLVVMVIGGGVAPPSESKRMPGPAGERGEGHGAVQRGGEGWLRGGPHVSNWRDQIKPAAETTVYTYSPIHVVHVVKSNGIQSCTCTCTCTLHWSSYKNCCNNNAHIWLMLPFLNPSPNLYRGFTITISRQRKCSFRILVFLLRKEQSHCTLVSCWAGCWGGPGRSFSS